MMQILPNKRQKRQPKEKGRRREEEKTKRGGGLNFLFIIINIYICNINRL
jgi:hypothetical protein